MILVAKSLFLPSHNLLYCNRTEFAMKRSILASGSLSQNVGRYCPLSFNFFSTQDLTAHFS